MIIYYPTMGGGPEQVEQGSQQPAPRHEELYIHMSELDTELNKYDLKVISLKYTDDIINEIEQQLQQQDDERSYAELSIDEKAESLQVVLDQLANVKRLLGQEFVDIIDHPNSHVPFAELLKLNEEIQDQIKAPKSKDLKKLADEVRSDIKEAKTGTFRIVGESELSRMIDILGLSGDVDKEMNLEELKKFLDAEFQEFGLDMSQLDGLSKKDRERFALVQSYLVEHAETIRQEIVIDLVEKLQEARQEGDYKQLIRKDGTLKRRGKELLAGVKASLSLPRMQNMMLAGMMVNMRTIRQELENWDDQAQIGFQEQLEQGLREEGVQGVYDIIGMALEDMPILRAGMAEEGIETGMETALGQAAKGGEYVRKKDRMDYMINYFDDSMAYFDHLSNTVDYFEAVRQGDQALAAMQPRLRDPLQAESAEDLSSTAQRDEELLKQFAADRSGIVEQLDLEDQLQQSEHVERAGVVEGVGEMLDQFEQSWAGDLLSGMGVDREYLVGLLDPNNTDGFAKVVRGIVGVFLKLAGFNMSVDELYEELKLHEFKEEAVSMTNSYVATIDHGASVTNPIEPAIYHGLDKSVPDSLDSYQSFADLQAEELEEGTKSSEEALKEVENTDIEPGEATKEQLTKRAMVEKMMGDIDWQVMMKICLEQSDQKPYFPTAFISQVQKGLPRKFTVGSSEEFSYEKFWSNATEKDQENLFQQFLVYEIANNILTTEASGLRSDLVVQKLFQEYLYGVRQYETSQQFEGMPERILTDRIDTQTDILTFDNMQFDATKQYRLVALDGPTGSLVEFDSEQGGFDAYELFEHYLDVYQNGERKAFPVKLQEVQQKEQQGKTVTEFVDKGLSYIDFPEKYFAALAEQPDGGVATDPSLADQDAQVVELGEGQDLVGGGGVSDVEAPRPEVSLERDEE